MNPQILLLLLGLVAISCGAPGGDALSTAAAADRLPSWNEGASRKALVGFVERTTRPDSGDFVPPAERIAVFDNDGTLWAEQPMYVQLAFALDRIKALAPRHPEWKTMQPFKGVLDNDIKAVLDTGAAGLMQIVAASHAGMTTEEFEAIVTDWIASARHPRTGRRYDEMIYQPMLDVMTYLRAQGFKTFIVSGGGVEFMRPWVERVYGIPPEQVVGSRVKVKYALQDDVPVLLRLPEIDLNDDKAGKPVGIHQVIGRRPTIAFGNSDGDFEMLEWTTRAKGPRLGVIVHHTDAEREWAYDRESHVGRLARGLDEAGRRGWLIVDMKSDWKVVYPVRR
jgi:phosphoglycolate phosphatase-like HAD superfamily hydrolase